MVTAHLNGDIVVCPDHKANYIKRMRKYDKAGKCRYGVSICSCKVARDFKLKVTPAAGRVNTHSCYLYKSEQCPKNVLYRDYGKRKKSFKMTNAHYKQIADRAAYMKEETQYKLLFLTLTFGEWKHEEITNEQANKCFSKFIENLSKTYKRGNYIAVRERSKENTKRLHFHLVIDMPYADFRDINNAWCHATSDYCNYSPNALSSDRDARYIKSTISVVRYICKYISKARTQNSDSRIIFCSRDVTQAYTKADISHAEFRTILKEFKSVQVYKHNNYCWRYSISTPPGSSPEQKTRSIKAANAFYYQIIRGIFGYMDKKNTSLHIFPTEKHIKNT